ncbi:sensor histidine kinase [Roseomonas fluvialis]|uniref:histidine kinase n=1 Tax=Roseomonas fluvialis TaxID=1750527 RepID=A0ABM7Y8W2_9PROT|nr:sensor histidine kinase [Roseomonas fluvialis]BDG74466.1 hypothetical protein Rmf_43950 [Roseomonas fluvialis]
MPIAVRLALLWLAAAAFAVTVAGLAVSMIRHDNLNAARSSLSQQVEGMAARQRRALAEVDQAIASSVARLAPSLETDCRAESRAAHAETRLLVVFVVVGRDGDVSCADADSVATLQVATRLTARVLADRRPRWMGPAPSGTGEPPLMVSIHPLPDDDADRAGVVLGITSVARLVDLAPPSDWKLSWIDRSGTILHRFADGTSASEGAGTLSARAAVTDDVVLLATTRRPEVPASAMLLLMAAAAVMVAGGPVMIAVGGRRWFTRPLRVLESHVTEGSVRSQQIDTWPPEVRALGCTMAARDEAWAEVVAQRGLLLDEVNHRVANTLQMIVSLLRIEADRIDDGLTDPGSAANVLRDAEERVATVATVHRSLRCIDADGPADMRHLLWSICDRLVAAHGLAGRVSIEVKVPPPPLNSDEAIAIALLVTEWTTMSLRAVSSQETSGCISITLHNGEKQRELLHVSDLAGGIRTQDAGLGETIVAGLVRQVGGRLMEVTGVWRGVRLVFPTRTA